VDGFRIDAAKHMAPGDLAGILGRVSGEPYAFLEVIDPGYEAVRASDYAALPADITEFKGASMSEAFLNRNARLKDLRTVGDVNHGYLAPERAVSFVDNHDTQRGSALTYHDGVLHDLATVFLLAWPYGYPQLMSSYAFDRESEASRSSGPPGESVFARGDVPECQDHPGRGQPGQWVCEHRAAYVANLVRLRARAASAPVSRWWDNGDNQIAFAREGRGFVVINRQEQTLQQTFDTGLPAGNYCEMYGGSMRDKTCTGRSVRVDGEGRSTVEVEGMGALILDADERI
jgi:alpha-amylase